MPEKWKDMALSPSAHARALIDLWEVSRELHRLGAHVKALTDMLLAQHEARGKEERDD